MIHRRGSSTSPAANTLGHNNLSPQRTPDLILTPIQPLAIDLLAQWPKRLILIHASLDNIIESQNRGRHQGIDLTLQLLTVRVQWQIIDVVAEWVLELVADGRDAEDDVCCGDGTGNGDPLQGVVELEGEEVDVDEYDLRDEDVVADWEWGGQDTLEVTSAVGQRGQGVHELRADDGGLELAVVGNLVEVCGDVGENLQWHVAEWAIGALHLLAWVGHGELQTGVLAESLPWRLLDRLEVLWLVCCLCIRIEMSDQVLDIIVMGIWLEAKAMLDRLGEGENEVHSCDLLKEILACGLRTLLNVDPDVTGQVAALDDECAECLATLRVALVGSGGAERERETDDETEDGEKEGGNADWPV